MTAEERLRNFINGKADYSYSKRYFGTIKLFDDIEEILNRLEEARKVLRKHLEAKDYYNDKYEYFNREYLEELLKILGDDRYV